MKNISDSINIGTKVTGKNASLVNSFTSIIEKNLLLNEVALLLKGNPKSH